MRIITTWNNNFHCEWYHCEIDNHRYSSPRREDVQTRINFYKTTNTN